MARSVLGVGQPALGAAGIHSDRGPTAVAHTLECRHDLEEAILSWVSAAFDGQSPITARGADLVRGFNWHWAGGRPLLFGATVVAAAAINWVAGLIVNTARLPIFGDTIGTVLVGTLFGPAAGAVAGAISNLGGAIYNPLLPWFIMTAATVGFLAGIAGGLDWMRRPWRAVLFGGGVGLVSAAISAPVSAAVSAGATPSGLYTVLVATARTQGLSIFQSTYVASLATDPLDKAVTFGLVSIIVSLLPGHLHARFPGARAEDPS